jgi:glycosyltransferase involved in cell wall biosynthesis
MEISVKFSIVVVALNPGSRLKTTLDSILSQTYENYEIIVKDGGSTDGSVESTIGMLDGRKCSRTESTGKCVIKDERIRFIRHKDTGIYDAMNQAVSCAEGDYVLFLNCGDIFYDKNVLENTVKYIKSNLSVDNDKNTDKQKLYVLYGDTYSIKTDTLIVSPPQIDGFTCYRNIPCHQSCFYSTQLCRQKPYNPQYKIRADYEHFLWCYYTAGAEMHHMGFTVSAYEGGGYSESKKNRQRNKQEHKEITSIYIPKAELRKYRLIMALTLAPLRSYMADNKLFSGVYHHLKKILYSHKSY